MNDEERLEFALAFIEALMPDPIVVPSAVRAASRRAVEHRTKAKGRAAGPALKQRDKEIRGHVKAGRSVQWCAAEYELGVTQVYEIVNGRRDAA